MKNKKGIELEILAWWIIAVVVLVIIVVALIILNTKGISLIDFIKDLFRFKS